MNYSPIRSNSKVGPTPLGFQVETQYEGKRPTVTTEANEHRAEAGRLFREEGLSQPPIDGPDCFSLQWFLTLEHRRYSRRSEWISRLLGFGRHGGETLLGLGNGVGTDWVQYARQGANVVVCCPDTFRLRLIRQNFELRGLKGRFLHAGPTNLPLADDSVDVACLNGLLHEIAAPAAVLRQIFRVLKPGGKVLAVVPAKYDVTYWKRVLFPWTQFADQQSTSAGFSRRGLKGLFQAFEVHRIHKRHVRRKKVPLPFRYIPSYCLHRLVGEFLIVKAFKPITAATSSRLAA